MADNSDKNQVVTNEDQSTQNEYISIINKKIRALKKKCQNIAYINEKIAAKVAINSDQQKLLATQDQVIRSLNEFEAIRNQFVDIYNNEQKALKEKSKFSVQENKNEVNDAIRAMITLLHVTQIFDRTRSEGIDARKAFFTEVSSKPSLVKDDADIDNVFYVMHTFFGTPLSAAIESGQKFAADSDAEFAPGLSYKHLRAIADELASSYIFKGVSSGIPEQKVDVEEQTFETHQEPQQPEVSEPQNVIPDQQESTENQIQQPQQDAQENGEHQVETEQDEGYQTTERKGRGGRGRGRGQRGGRDFGQREYDNNNNRGGQRGGRGRGRDFGERGSPREGRKFERGSSRGGQREYDNNSRGGQRGGRGRDFDRQTQQQ